MQNVGGIYTPLVADSGVPGRMKDIAQRLAADHEQMINWYDVEFSGDAKLLQATINVGVTRDGVHVAMSPRRPF